MKPLSDQELAAHLRTAADLVPGWDLELLDAAQRLEGWSDPTAELIDLRAVLLRAVRHFVEAHKSSQSSELCSICILIDRDAAELLNSKSARTEHAVGPVGTLRPGAGPKVPQPSNEASVESTPTTASTVRADTDEAQEMAIEEAASILTSVKIQIGKRKDLTVVEREVLKTVSEWLQLHPIPTGEA